MNGYSSYIAWVPMIYKIKAKQQMNIDKIAQDPLLDQLKKMIFIGFEFEFYSNHDINKTKTLISELLQKKISIENKAHSEFKPTQDHFKMEPDMSGGSGMIELVTGPIGYTETTLILKKTLNWIKENGSTTHRCSVHINISFLGEGGTVYNLNKLDIGKFVLNFDEALVYKLFPERENSVYAKSIKYIMPTQGICLKPSGELDYKNFIFVNEKYYGVNFTKLAKNYLEFRYIGGKDYHLRYTDIITCIHHFGLSLMKTLVDKRYTKKDYAELQKIITAHKLITNAHRSYDVFAETFKSIKITVDLKQDVQLIKAYYPIIRDKLFEILTKTDVIDCHINYDTDQSRIQMKDANIEKSFYLEGIDCVDCKIRGNIANCDLFNCEIIDSSVVVSNLFTSTKIEASKVENCYASKNVEAIDCYIFGKLGVFSGKTKGGIFREGRITHHAKIDATTELVEYEKINFKQYNTQYGQM